MKIKRTLAVSERPLSGARQMIGGADTLLLAQLSSFSRPDLAEPFSDENGNGSDEIAVSTVAFSPTCPRQDDVTETGSGKFACSMPSTRFDESSLTPRVTRTFTKCRVASAHRFRGSGEPFLSCQRGGEA